MVASVGILGGEVHLPEEMQRIRYMWDALGMVADVTFPGRVTKILEMIGSTRERFAELEGIFSTELAVSERKKTLLFLRFRSQWTITLLIRNLYERTADVGFLRLDYTVRSFILAGAPKEEVEKNRSRLREYVKNYSVYRDIVVFSPDGKVLLRLDENGSQELVQDAFLGRSIHTSGHIESYGEFGFLDGDRNLVYSRRIVGDDEEVIGVLALVFRFEDEMSRIFKQLGAKGVIYLCLSDQNGKILASSDEDLFSPGRNIQIANHPEGETHFFMGQKFFEVSFKGGSYQGYDGPGWYGHAFVPVQYLDELNNATIDGATLEKILQYADVLCPSLCSIFQDVERINQDLKTVVWNGSIAAVANQSEQQAQLKALLAKIQDTGNKTTQVFSRAIRQLAATEASLFFTTITDIATLTGYIMDANLYERSNDARWWAYFERLCLILSKGEISKSDTQEMQEILKEINDLYTVYTRIVVFDANKTVVAESDLHSDGISLAGERLEGAWVNAVLALKDTRQYVVSPFEPTHLYGGYPTYTYAAGVRDSETDRVVGGVAIVFDSGPQFSAMLNECVSNLPGSYGLFVEKNTRRIVAVSSDSGHHIGEIAEFPEEFLQVGRGQSCTKFVEYRGKCCIIAAVGNSGYREYTTTGDHNNPIISLVVLPIGDPMEQGSQVKLSSYDTGEITTAPRTFGTFVIGGQIYAIAAESICEVISSAGMESPVIGTRGYIAGTIGYRDSTPGGSGLKTPIQVIHGAKLFRKKKTITTDYQNIVVVRCKNGIFGILVESVDAVPTFDANRIGKLSVCFSDDDGGCTPLAIMPVVSNPNVPPIAIFDTDRTAEILGTLPSLSRKK